MIQQSANGVLTINGGSSSIKFAVYTMDSDYTPLLHGEIEKIGQEHPQLNFFSAGTDQKSTLPIKAADQKEAALALIDWLEQQNVFDTIQAIGHRVVHGMQHTAPEKITPALLNELKAISAYDPEHLPGEIKLIEVFSEHYPALPQVACFDTSFHTAMPPVAKLLPLPRRFTEMGIQRYGFHGLSYAWLLEALNPAVTQGCLILAHLGNGASLAAVKDGKSIDTSMGFTPASGLPMGTRTGDLDPGVAWYLMQSQQLNPQQFSHLINHESGLLGISETSSDMRVLLQAEQADPRAAEAIELFCYQTKKWIGSFAAVLGGLDTLVFTGGIGENSPEVRKRICSGLAFLGIELQEESNEKNEAIISAGTSRVCVRVMKTNEERMIAQLVSQLLNEPANNPAKQ